MSFSGFPEGALDFYRELEADNTKSFWTANKHRYEELVKKPMTELCAALADVGAFRLFRPYQDQRFAKNRPPYKIAQGAYTEGEDGCGFYLHLGGDGFMCGAGYYAMAKDQLAAFRDAVDDDETGPELVALLDTVTPTYQIGAIDQLKTAPRGYPRDHPRIELLRRKGLIVSKEFGTPKWIHTKAVEGRVRAMWADAAPVTGWLDRHVGPSELEPMGFG